jgi:hypothetical protein
MRCRLSALLRRTRREYSDDNRDQGTAAHRYLERIGDVGLDAALAEVVEDHREYCGRIDVSRLPACRPDQYAREVAFAYDWETGEAREIGRGIERAYPARPTPTTIFGTADSVGVDERQVIVTDYKSWSRAKAREQWQVIGLAVAAAAVYHRDAATTAIASLRDGDPWTDSARLDALDLGAAQSQIRETLSGLLEADPEKLDPVEGDWCRYCPGFTSCPAKARLATALGSGDLQLPTLSVETGPAILAALKRGEDLLERIKEAVQEFAKVTPIPGENGQVYGPRPYPRDRIDPEAAVRVLSGYGDASLAIKETRTFVKERFVDQVLVPYLRTHPAPKAKAVEAAMEDLRRAGALTTAFTYPVGWHKAKALPAAKEAPCASDS